MQPRLIALYGSPGSVGAFAEGAALQEIYSILTAIRGWMANDTFHLPTLSQRLLTMGSMVCFPVHKGYFGKPAHHTGVSALSWLLISKLLNPQPAAPGQDALGLITIYPRPDERFLLASFGGSFLRNPSYYAKRYVSTYEIKYHI